MFYVLMYMTNVNISYSNSICSFNLVLLIFIVMVAFDNLY